MIQYSNGDGNDLIEGFNSTSTLSIDGENYSSVASGNDLILTVGDGSITLTDEATLTNPNIIGNLSGYSSDTQTPDTTPPDTTPSGAIDITNNTNNIVVAGTAYNRTLTNNGSRVTVNALAGNDIVNNIGANANVDGGSGNDSITGSGNNSFLAGGMGMIH